ncbi:tetratricopeptide repeat protein [Succinimonas amylolytica]|uniref:tetratricopeptide repeat protein n=1 Tax=Succinimonas amylolytica TaxID=83769 RepID=UPI00037595A0|nr:sel1 repeat family protein [Succinimonas amylolytica]
MTRFSRAILFTALLASSGAWALSQDMLYGLFSRDDCIQDGLPADLCTRGLHDMDREALRKIGALYLKDTPDRNRYFRGITAYGLAIRNHDPQAETELALYYLNNVSEKHDEAVRLLHLAALNGVPEAQYYLALLYMVGDGDIKQDFLVSYSWAMRAAEKGFSPAVSFVGYCYLSGTGVINSLKDSVKWYVRAVEMGDPNAAYALGWLKLVSNAPFFDPKEALRLFKISSEAGIPGADNAIGVMYGEGIGTERDLRLSDYYFEKAIKAGDKAAILNQAIRNVRVEGTSDPVKNERNIAIFIRAFENGEADAAAGIARIYLGGQEKFGQGQVLEAIDWLRKGAEMGSAVSMYLLGKSYAEGHNIPKSCHDAFTWSSRAVEKQFYPAERVLSSLYENGCGAPRDNEMARALMDRYERHASHEIFPYKVLFYRPQFFGSGEDTVAPGHYHELFTGRKDIPLEEPAGTE